MFRTRRSMFTAISSTSFVVGLTAFILIDRFLVPKVFGAGNDYEIVVTILSTLGVYAFLYQFIYLAFDRLYPRLGASLHIAGEWYQIFCVTKVDGDGVSFRHGPCSIVASGETIAIVAQTYREDGSYSSSWQSEAVVVNNAVLTVLFVSESASAERGVTRGTMTYSVIGSRPKRLVGQFADSTPARNSGPITLYREKEKYERQLKIDAPNAVPVDAR